MRFAFQLVLAVLAAEDFSKAQNTAPIPEPIVEISSTWPPDGLYLKHELKRPTDIEITCKLSPLPKLADDDNVTVELFDDNTLSSFKNGTATFDDLILDNDRLEFDFDLTPSVTELYGTVRCRYRYGQNNVFAFASNNSIKLPFLPCTIGEYREQCERQCDSGNVGYCIVNEQAAKPCAKLDPSWCYLESNDSKQALYCPVNQRGACSAAAKDSNQIWFKVENSGSCPQMDTTTPPLTFKNTGLTFNEVFIAENSTRTIHLRCPEGSPFYSQTVTIEETRLPYHEPRWQSYVDASSKVCKDEMTITINDSPFKLEPGARKLEPIWIKVTLAGGGTAKFVTAYLPVGAFRLHASIGGDQLKCFTQTWRKTSNTPTEARVEMWATKSSNAGQRIELERVDNEKGLAGYVNISADGPDRYQCHANFRFASCFPQRPFLRYLNSTIEEYSRAWRLFVDSRYSLIAAAAAIFRHFQLTQLKESL